MKRNLIAWLLAAALLLSLAGCSSSSTTVRNAEDLMAGILANPAAASTETSPDGAAVTDFGVRLLQNSMQPGESTLVSPLSVLSALAMTANGADGQTLSQMETALGLPVDGLNAFLSCYRDRDALALANSIWFRDTPSLSVQEEFLQTNADHYDAGIYKAPFDDSTRDAINSWVDDRTNHMIDGIVDEIPSEAVMYLVNALAFESEWDQPYQSYQVHDGIFTTEDGREQDVQLMYSEEWSYLEDSQATGFIKYYENHTYAFAALLPEEGISVADYVSGLTGQRLYDLLSSPEETMVDAALPKFDVTCGLELSQVLKAMGMTDAFDVEAADFSRLGSSQDGNIYLSRVLHKTFISVTELGTRAGAATAVEAAAGATAIEPKTVTLDRPFVYLLIDCETNTPFFLGTMMDPAA